MKVRILLMGFGNVGKGFSSLLIEKEEMIRRSFRLEPIIVGICTKSRGNLYDPKGIDLSKLHQVEDGASFMSSPDISACITSFSPDELVARGEYDVLAECTITKKDGRGPALGYIRTALAKGRSVITTNKGPIAFFFNDLNRLAESSGAKLLFEGTVMAGTPVFSTSLAGLSGSSINGFEGVLNGTCNFVLELIQNGMSYENALEQAQKNGYAEADPSMDVEGIDSALKAMILSQVLMGTPVSDLEAVDIHGISDLDLELLNRTRSKSEKIRLIAKGEKVNGKTRLSVRPTSLFPDHPLYNLPGAVNGIVLNTDTLGSVCLTGAGAGSRETGFALLQDLISLSSRDSRFSSSQSSSK